MKSGPEPPRLHYERVGCLSEAEQRRWWRQKKGRTGRVIDWPECLTCVGVCVRFLVLAIYRAPKYAFHYQSEDIFEKRAHFERKLWNSSQRLKYKRVCVYVHVHTRALGHNIWAYFRHQLWEGKNKKKRGGRVWKVGSHAMCLCWLMS